eukprot:CAMPEP_0184867768 /NCGR_PEP_ID=MMETSP0580-20130426/27641_1 /TAXON_ID=1118495 /ORGANISM="Dactyliosolen fragilissimus" /LENGTH=234 /DNA_ID=CAMNT_0027368217 /DNA_START=244 /DNA_END=945 /DNA_ORIENTATION=+
MAYRSSTSTTIKSSHQHKFVTNKMCPFAQKAWIALETSSTPYQMIEISLYGPNGKPDWFLDMNPYGTVPVLSWNDDDQKEKNNPSYSSPSTIILTDSEDILTHLASNLQPLPLSSSSTTTPTRPQQLLTNPTNPSTQQSIETWRKTILPKQLLPIGKQAVLQKSKQNKQKLMNLLQDINDHHMHPDGPFLCGTEPTVADCAAFPFLWRIDEEFGPLMESSSSSHSECYGKIRSW